MSISKRGRYCNENNSHYGFLHIPRNGVLVSGDMQKSPESGQEKRSLSKGDKRSIVIVFNERKYADIFTRKWVKKQQKCGFCCQYLA
jgi:hypothetical protein